MQYLSRDLDPVVMKSCLHLGDSGPFDAIVRVAPVIPVLRIAGPEVRNADAAGEADPAVHDEQLAVRAVVEASERVPMGTVVALHLDACPFHLLDIARVDLAAAH